MISKKAGLTASACGLVMALSGIFASAATLADYPDSALHIHLADTFGRAVKNSIRVDVARTCSGIEKTASYHIPSQTENASLENVFDESCWNYQIKAYADSYQGSFHRLNAADIDKKSIDIKMKINPRQARTTDFPSYEDMPPALQRILERSMVGENHTGLSGKALYNDLQPLHKAAFLNLTAKAGATVLPDGSTVLDHINSVFDIDGDRMFTIVDNNLYGHIASSVRQHTFSKRSAFTSALHHPPKDFKKQGSFKTPDTHGNLDITLSTDGTLSVAEIDIDENRGTLHIFEVIDNYMPYRLKKTHPYNVAQILFRDQGIDPGYRFEP